MVYIPYHLQRSYLPSHLIRSCAAAIVKGIQCLDEYPDIIADAFSALAFYFGGYVYQQALSPIPAKGHLNNIDGICYSLNLKWSIRREQKYVFLYLWNEKHEFAIYVHSNNKVDPIGPSPPSQYGWQLKA